ncbi:MAG: hydantoinase B/oxoprolinase family protein [Verrucomicrobiales bacterium]|nr:hydantoinase B/oxoprolinase family protein [Verrucomicrobiales bacterium]
MFKLRVDTGGTFTDCWGLAPGEAVPRLAKVLSSGRLRVPVRKWITPSTLEIEVPSSWRIKEAFFTGYKLESGDGSALILSFEAGNQRITLSRGLTEAPSVDLFTREEAPVIGARLLTGTALDEAFPPLDFRLATTRGTNALLERKGAKIAFFTTEGFGDLLTIRDQRRPDLFALKHERPDPLFAAVEEVPGRLDATGGELAPLELGTNFDERARALIDDGINVAAIALLHSYLNPQHEDALKNRLLDLGFLHVSSSAELAPLIKLLPRAETCVANAYLQPVMQSFLDHIADRVGDGGQILTMTSAGGLEPIDSYCPKDSLLSGPAGGVSGAAAVAESLGINRILTFDMGGTSTDVARYDHAFQYRFEQTVGDARLLSPALKIETVAAGGGSICQWKNGGLLVGPESAGAEPGPACYGRGGPLTITDVNLLLQRIDPDNFGIPLTDESFEAAKTAAIQLQKEAGIEGMDLNPSFLSGLLDIAVEQMADAIRSISIRDGADPADYALLAFGGAGPLHACDIATRLEMTTVIVPAEAGLLSAYGLDRAVVERFAERQINLSIHSPDLENQLEEVDRKALDALAETGYEGSLTQRLAELRLTGQDATLSIRLTEADDLETLFSREYHAVFGYAPAADRTIEVVSYRAIAGTEREVTLSSCVPLSKLTGLGSGPNPVEWMDRSRLETGTVISGPVVIQDPFSTFYLNEGWRATVAGNGALVANFKNETSSTSEVRPPQIVQELFRHRFEQLVVEMGTMLQRSAISTNVKERADFSCALLDRTGELITSAPHIPVHLGALGVCVRMVSDQIRMNRGDTIVTNHPAAGGSHLPDVTLITPVFDNSGDKPVAFIANRAHHAEIGGIAPGSMPPGAASLAEEGVVISPTHLIREGESCFDRVSEILTSAPFPTRNLKDNLADLNAQLAANRRGQAILESMMEKHGTAEITHQLQHLKSRSLDALATRLRKAELDEGSVTESLDDGTEISVHISRQNERLRIDFNGTSREHPGNLNATPAIIQSAVLYVLRLWSQTEVPLNEGMLDLVDIILPQCFLNPRFDPDPTQCPAVVGGNVETSQRVVDTLIRALKIQACSQGTMNNFLFGDESFGYYETICGGTGAGEGYDGSSAIHSHMTNTSITDPEILEYRYPVRLLKFAIRPRSGGIGKWHGGDGVIRSIEFLKPLQVSLLTQHRKVSPYGMMGGENGVRGQQHLNGKRLDGITCFHAGSGDILVIETPGGGGWGEG